MSPEEMIRLSEESVAAGNGRLLFIGSDVFNAERDYPAEEVALFSDSWEGEDLWFVLEGVRAGDPDGFYPEELKIYQQYLQDKELLWNLYSEWCNLKGCGTSEETCIRSQYRQYFWDLIHNDMIDDKQSFIVCMAGADISPKLWSAKECQTVYENFLLKMSKVQNNYK